MREQMIFHVFDTTGDGVIDKLSQSEPGCSALCLGGINHYSLIIVADSIYPSRGRHYERFHCPWVFID